MAFGNDAVVNSIALNEGQADAILKEVYSDDGVTDEFFRDNPFFALMPKKENARVSMFGFRGRILFEGAEFAFTLVDISENGMGIICASNLERGTNVEFEVYTPIGSVNGLGEIRYCRADADAANQFRVGVLVSELDRIERARWNQLLNSNLTP